MGNLGYPMVYCMYFVHQSWMEKIFVIKVDGTEVKPKDAFLSGDGFFCYLGGCYRTFRRRA